MINILTSHGWAFDHTMLHQSIPFPATVYARERGYFFEKVEDFSNLNCKINLIITHSFGLHFIHPHLVKQADLVVGIGSFYHFSWISQLKKLKSDFQNDPLTTLRHFYSLCSKRNTIQVPKNINKELLLEDLELLKKSCISSEVLTALTGKLLLFHGTKDLVVPSQASKELLEKVIGSEVVLIDGASHLFSDEEMAECYKVIKERLKVY